MDAALVIVDMQKDVLEGMCGFGKDIVGNVSTLLNAFRGAGKPVIHVKRVHRPDGVDVELFRVKRFKKKPFLVQGTEGAEVIDELRPLEGECIVEKQRFSAFFQTGLELVLKRLGVDALVVTGVQTPNCIRATVVDAIGYDYNVVVVDDATNAATPEIHKSNLLDMENMGVRIMKTSELVEGLEE
jgi:nicotinamidase-related amidase